MSRAARITLVVLVVAIAFVGGAFAWITMRGDESDHVALPAAGDVRVVTADPGIDLPVLVEVPGTAAGCPAATFRSPTEPVVPPSEGYAAVRLAGDARASLLAVCLGSVDELGTPEEIIADIWSGEGEELEDWERVSVERISSAHGEALALTSRVGTTVLTDHYVEHDGWVHAVGYLRDDGTDPDRAVVDAILASWEWR